LQVRFILYHFYTFTKTTLGSQGFLEAALMLNFGLIKIKGLGNMRLEKEKVERLKWKNIRITGGLCLLSV